jgi:muramoyltetrapeptide carboxypeptidase
VTADNKILFLEDLCEPAYRIDRMLTQLQNAGKFKKVRAVILGDFTECLESDGRELWKTEMKRFFSHAPFPVICGLPTGHGELRMPLPLGLQGTLTSKGHRIELQFNTSLVG